MLPSEQLSRRCSKIKILPCKPSKKCASFILARQGLHLVHELHSVVRQFLLIPESPTEKIFPRLGEDETFSDSLEGTHNGYDYMGFDQVIFLNGSDIGVTI